MNNQFPIIIPFKEYSQRFNNKNFLLFSYVYAWLKKIGKIDNAYVVTKSDIVKNFLYNCFNDIKVLDELTKYTNGDNIIATYCVAKLLNADYYFELPITQPLRSVNLIDNILLQDYEKYDFITTYLNVVDRSIFYLDETCLKFEIEQKHHKGSLCKAKKMIDGSIYFIKSKFMQNLIEDEDTDFNAKFWTGHFLAIEHDVPFFVDVDYEKDFKGFGLLRGI